MPPFSCRPAVSLCCLLLASLNAHSQGTRWAPSPSSAAPATQLSPGAAYQDALHPLEVTRHNIANWSDVELAAMSVAVANAKAGCLGRKLSDYTGADLVDLARLCSLGQQWPAVVDAASRFIDGAGPSTSVSPSRPLLTEAYVAKTEAFLRLKDEPAALASALTMLSAVPYSADVGDATDEAVNYMRFVHTVDALRLATARQAFILGRLRLPPASALTGAPNPSPSASIAPHVLYAQGLQLAVLQQLSAQSEATATVTALHAAISDVLDPDEKLRIGRLDKQYMLLGKPLSGVKPLTSLSSPRQKLPQLPATHTITALLLFPDWCATCVRLGPHFPETVFQVEGHSAYLYALLAETVPPRTPDASVTNAAYNPAYAASFLAETPTVTVDGATLDRFPADDYPLLLLTDAQGILRVLQPMTPQDLQPGGDLDAAIALVGRTFRQAEAPAKTTDENPSSTPAAARR